VFNFGVMRLRRRLGLVAAGYIAVMAGIGGFALDAARSRADYANKGRSLTVGLEQVGRLRAAFLNMETGQRGFDLTKDQAFLQPFEEGRRAALALEGPLQGAVRGDKTLETALQETLAVGSRWLTAFAEPAVTASEASGVVGASGSRIAEGKTAFDALRDRLSQLENMLEKRRDQADQNRERSARRLSVLVLSGPILAVAGTAIASRQLDRWILHPIEAMGVAAERIRSGDLTGTVPMLGPPDVAELGQRVEDMRRTIVAQRDSEVRARESVEQNALLAVRVRNALAADVGELPPGWTGAASMLPAEGIVAGDCYDVTLLSPTTLATVVIDIAGHGGGPAVTALRCKEILRAALRARMSPGEALSHLAGQVGDLDESFLTAFVATINTVSGDCRYASAGHPPAFLQNGGVLEELMPTGPLIGPFAGNWRTESRTIGLGGQLAIYTDGLTEARNSGRVFYGMERLTAKIMSVPCVDAQHVIDVCFADLKAFRSERLIDDVTMVMVCRDCPDPELDV
jgi:serine phosphatase RsbU (regulator of sigma subunit)/CHASE3 domain sensor protein